MRWLAVLLLVLALDASAKPNRVALVIGNAAYPGDAALPNPVNDARDMTALLQKAGFEVITRENAGLKDMHRALREFGDKLNRESLGLLYFAGHGVQVRGRNYLVPVDADIGREDEVAFNALDLQAVLEKMDTARNATNLIILDACRNNPFADRFKPANAGLAQIDAPPGTLVAFSTAPGSVAADGLPGARNGLYTQHLLAHLARPGVRIEDAFKQVRAAVRADSKGLQTPWESTSLEGELHLVAAPKAPEPKPVTTLRARSTQPGAAPHVEVGDQWTWRYTDKLKNTTRTFKRRVVELTGDTYTLDNGTVHDLNGNGIRLLVGDSPRIYTPSTLYYIFPLLPGLAWSGSYIEHIDGEPVSDITVKIRVLGEEDYAAPFGTLKAMKVERQSEWVSRRTGNKGNTLATYWYNAQVKGPLRQEFRNATASGKVLTDEVKELLGFEQVKGAGKNAATPR